MGGVSGCHGVSSLNSVVDGTGGAGVRGQARSHRYSAKFEINTNPVGAGLPAKRPVRPLSMQKWIALERRSQGIRLGPSDLHGAQAINH
ncbi:hypothetical protein E6B08_16695 [Pseudomonas putida]|uniref:Uncharacterized protein n=1 Tax=Pseudomonas putida TaxID=303 RepID=A0A4D6XE06_PSEPU|nr:hypothetical protein E6B08_16695 [Pseudomonas putida]